MAMGYIVLSTDKSSVKWEPYTGVYDTPEDAQVVAEKRAQGEAPDTGARTFVIADVTSVRNINAALVKAAHSKP